MSNHLATETSPYLRQHAANPVDWWPWGDAALTAARAQNKPILLSIGYAACHWCHVMAHESFEDEDVARVMNAHFINIKVDREERPDIDKVYQLAHQALARRGGGWPLTMFLTPDDLLPFHAGTYFPKTPRYGMPGFVQVLEGVRRWFDEKPEEVRAQNGALAHFLADHARGDAHAGELDDGPIKVALDRIAANFDRINGGHLGGPKFPHASEIELLLAMAARDARATSLTQQSAQDEGVTAPQSTTEATAENAERLSPAAMAQLSLRRMAERGLSDHLGGGFFRYCVDERWEIPHFEKMLYDNAQLLPLYARASRAYQTGTIARASRAYQSGTTARGSHEHASSATADSDSARDESEFAHATRACAQWIAHDMTAPSGGFWSSLDADSEGEEGRYYVWQRSEIRVVLTADEFAVAEPHYGLDQPPNFEDQAWHLLVATPRDDIASRTGIPLSVVEQRLASANSVLLATRSQRVRPALDDKILTAWNALTIAGAARAARWLPDRPLLAEAERALDFLYANLWKDGRLYACHAGGVARFPAYLDDHAFLLDALLALLQVRWNRRDLDWAIALADALLEHFEDADQGGFYFTAHDAEALPQRPKPFMDESLPSGNGTAARALLALGHLLGEPRYLDAAERTLRAAWPTLREAPNACCTLLLALDELLHPRTHVLLRVDRDEVERWRESIDRIDAAQADVYCIPPTAIPLPATLGAQERRAGGVAYVCRGTRCLPPVYNPSAFSVDWL